MSIDTLFRQLTDIRFQADKILKSKQLDAEQVGKFATYSRKIKESMYAMGLNEELALHVNEIHDIDPEFDPQAPFHTRVMNALSFGYASKKYKQRKRDEYFRHHIRNTRDQYSHIDFLLKEL